MFLAHGLDHPRHQQSSSFGVIRRQRLLRKITAPQLPRNHPQLTVHPDELRFGIGQHLIRANTGIEHPFEFLGEALPAQPPLTRGPGHEVFFEKLLIPLQSGHHRRGGRLEFGPLRCFTGQFQDLRLIECNGPLVLPDGRLKNGPGRMAQRAFSLVQNGGDLAHPSDSIPNIVLLGPRGLGQQRIDAVAHVAAVNPGILFEGAGVVVEPQRRLEIVAEDFEINLTVPAQGPILHCLGQRLQRGPGLRHPSGPGGFRDILQLIIESVIAQQRGRRWFQPERRVQATLVERPQRRIGICR